MNSYFDNLAEGWDNNPLKVERATLTANKIKDIKLHANNSCIDFGSGTGLLGVQLKDNFTQVHLVDASNEMLRVARDKLTNAAISNVTTQHVAGLSLVKGQHSAIVTLMTLHHLDDINAFFTDAYCCLEAKGTLAIADLYAEDGSFHKHDPSFTGHNGFQPEQLAAMAERAGFTVEKIEPYYEIRQANFAGEEVAYPLFMLVARK